MNLKPVLHILGALLLFVGFTFIIPITVSLIYREGDLGALLKSMGITLAVGLLLWRVFRTTADIRVREGFAVVAFAWAAIALAGSLPFMLGVDGISFTDAFFESMSGFTTTGATILTNIEALPHGILMWRSLTHWLGGMGIIVLSIAIMPVLGVGGMSMFKAEVPGPTPDKIKPRVQQTAKTLWGVYVLISAIEAMLLYFGGMSLFEAIAHTFGTMATGGFSTRNASIGYYNSAYIDAVITVFMFLAGVNFALHYQALRGRLSGYWRDYEFRFFLFLALGAITVVTVDNLFTTYSSFFESLRRSSFQVVSILTTTGYGTADYEKWSVTAQLLILLLMFIGGCAGSTGGGVKVVRSIVLVKQSLLELKRLVHPKAVLPLRLGERAVSPEAITGVLAFLGLYVTIAALSTVVMTLQGLDLVSAAAAVVASLGNIGPGLGSVGPTDNYAHITIFGKWVLSFLMLLGRLEIYTVLVIFTATFWKK
jgi:trk system potassium uptake protein TrkH